MQTILIQMTQDTDMVSHDRRALKETDLKRTECDNTGDTMRKPVYHNDYGPRYREPYDIYEKAREHIRNLKRKQ